MPDRKMTKEEAKLVNRIKNDVETIESVLERGSRGTALAGIKEAILTLRELQEEVTRNLEGQVLN